MERRTRYLSPVLPLAVTAILWLLGSSGAVAWMPSTQAAIGQAAAQIAPPDLARQIDKHKKHFYRGLQAPHANAGNGQAASTHAVTRTANQAIAAIENHRPFAEVVYKLGELTHYVANANNPLNAADYDPRESTYYRDYLHYVESARDRFPVVFYRNGRDVRDPEQFELLLTATAGRGRSLYPFVGREYRRIGTVDGRRLFDDRSTAFGVASLAYSHAISDAAAALRYVWLKSGGGDRRKLHLTSPKPQPERGLQGR